MIRLSWSTFRDRWQLFVGAVVAVAVGVALVQASLLTLVATAVPPIPPGLTPHDELVLRDGYAGAASLSAIIMGLSTFVAIFVVGSTFAFTVAQRRRDFALLRLVGATPRKVRRLLYGEAVLLGAIGALTGSLLGLVVARHQAGLYVRLRCVPAGFVAPWHWWVLTVSLGIGIGVGLLGSLAASRRAARVRALDALRQVGSADQVMTGTRWFAGIAAAALAIALLATASASADNRAMDAAIPACIASVIALTTLAPIVVPVVARVLESLTQAVLPRSRMSELVHANLRDGVRRTASTAAPVILLVGLVVGLAGTIQVINAGRRLEAIKTTVGDLVVETTHPVAPQLRAVDGVRTVDEETPMLIEARLDVGGDSALEPVEVVAVGPDDYTAVHRLGDVSGALSDLHGDAIAVDEGIASSMRVHVGDTTTLRIENLPVDVRVAAILPATMTGPEMLLSTDLAPHGAAERRYLIQTTDATEAPRVAERITSELRAMGIPTDESRVTPIADWVLHDIEERRHQTETMIVGILALVTLYIVISVVNAVVIAAADRREELAVARLAGLRRRQLVVAAVWESLAVVVVGLVLGGIAATATLLGVAAGVSDIVGTRVLDLPWTLAGVTAAGVALLVAATSGIAAFAATRAPAITIAGVRE